jgi:hypothetical protein
VDQKGLEQTCGDALQGAIEVKWIGRDWNRHVAMHCRVKEERS